MNIIERTYPALQHVGFRLYFYASMIGMLGLWVNITAQQWLVYTLTDSPIKLGLLGAAQFLPTMLLSLHAGVYIDRANKRLLVLCTQTMGMLVAFTLAFLVWSGYIEYWQVLALGLVSGLITTFDVPARQALIPELVQDKELRNAINLISVTINLARFLGPAISAFLIHDYGIAVCFFFNGLAYIPVLIMLLVIKPHSIAKIMQKERNVAAEIREGLHYAMSRIELRYPLAFVGVISMVLWNYTVTMPIFAGSILHGAVTDFGMLSASLGGGSLIGAFCASTFLKRAATVKEIMIFGGLYHVFYFITAFATSLWVAMLGFCIMGIFGILFLNSANAILQMNSTHEFRGRIMSLFSLVFFGAAPPGNIGSGWFLEQVNPAIGIRILPIISIALCIFLAYILRDKNKKDPSVDMEKVA